MMLKRIVSAAAMCGLLAGVVVAAEKAEVKLDGVQCVVAPKAAKAEKSASYKEGTVYFCCDGCKGKFEKDTAKYATKANKQLVATKQYEQKACPLTGNKTNPEKTVKVDGVVVAFCCGNCQGKVAAAEGEEQVALVFAEKPFEKGFTAKKEKEGDDK